MAAEADSGECAVAFATKFKPDVVISMVVSEYVQAELNKETALFAILTPREREVLKLVADCTDCGRH